MPPGARCPPPPQRRRRALGALASLPHRALPGAALLPPSGAQQRGQQALVRLLAQAAAAPHPQHPQALLGLHLRGQRLGRQTREAGDERMHIRPWLECRQQAAGGLRCAARCPQQGGTGPGGTARAGWGDAHAGGRTRACNQFAALNCIPRMHSALVCSALRMPGRAARTRPLHRPAGVGGARGEGAVCQQAWQLEQQSVRRPKLPPQGATGAGGCAAAAPRAAPSGPPLKDSGPGIQGAKKAAPQRSAAASMLLAGAGEAPRCTPCTSIGRLGLGPQCPAAAPGCPAPPHKSCRASAGRAAAGAAGAARHRMGCRWLPAPPDSRPPAVTRPCCPLTMKKNLARVPNTPITAAPAASSSRARRPTPTRLPPACSAACCSSRAGTPAPRISARPLASCRTRSRKLCWNGCCGGGGGAAAATGGSALEGGDAPSGSLRWLPCPCSASPAVARSRLGDMVQEGLQARAVRAAEDSVGFAVTLERPPQRCGWKRSDDSGVKSAAGRPLPARHRGAVLAAAAAPDGDLQAGPPAKLKRKPVEFKYQICGSLQSLLQPLPPRCPPSLAAVAGAEPAAQFLPVPTAACCMPVQSCPPLQSAVRDQERLDLGCQADGNMRCVCWHGPAARPAAEAPATAPLPQAVRCLPASLPPSLPLRSPCAASERCCARSPSASWRRVPCR